MFQVLVAYTVSGIVVDSETREPVPYCAIQLDGKGTYADEKGYFRLTVEEGRYVLRVSYLGYEEYVDTLLVDRDVSLKIYLKPKGVKLEEVVISARRNTFRRDFSITAIQDVSKYRKIPTSLEKDLLRILTLQSGVVFANDFSGRFSVRGSAPFENLTILDGMYLYNPYHLGSFVSVFDADVVNRFTFLKGGYSARYGNATGSIIEAETRHGSYDTTKITLISNPITFKTMVEGPINNYTSYMLNFRRSYIDEVLRYTDYAFPYYFYDVLGKLSYNYSDITTLGITFLNSEDVFRWNFIGINWGNRGVSFTYRTILRSLLFKNYTSFTNNFTNFEAFSGVFLTRSSFSIYSTRFVFDYIGSAFNTTFGMDLAYIDGFYRSNIFGVHRYIEGSAYLGSLFGEFRKEIGRLSMNLGLRANLYQLRGTYRKENASLEPRLQFKYFLSNVYALKLAVGLYEQYALAVSDPNLQIASFYYWAAPFDRFDPVRNVHVILGFEGIPEFGSFEVNVFFKPYMNTVITNLYPDIREAERSIFLNAKAVSYGMDIWYERGWLEVSYTLTFSYDKAENETYWKRTYWDRRHVANIIGKFSILGGEGGVKLTYASGNPYTDIVARYLSGSLSPEGGWDFIFWQSVISERNAVVLPDYRRVDIYYERSMFGGRLGVGILNVFNFKNLFFYFYDYTKNPPTKVEIYQFPMIPYVSFRKVF